MPKMYYYIKYTAASKKLSVIYYNMKPLQCTVRQRPPVAQRTGESTLQHAEGE